MKRTASEILKLKSMPVAESLKNEMNSYVDKLETIGIEQQELIDNLTFLQLQYKCYVYSELEESEAVLYKQLGLKLNEDVVKFPYTVKGEENG